MCSRDLWTDVKASCARRQVTGRCESQGIRTKTPTEGGWCSGDFAAEWAECVGPCCEPPNQPDSQEALPSESLLQQARMFFGSSWRSHKCGTEQGCFCANHLLVHAALTLPECQHHHTLHMHNSVELCVDKQHHLSGSEQGAAAIFPVGRSGGAAAAWPNRSSGRYSSGMMPTAGCESCTCAMHVLQNQSIRAHHMFYKPEQLKHVQPRCVVDV